MQIIFFVVIVVIGIVVSIAKSSMASSKAEDKQHEQKIDSRENSPRPAVEVKSHRFDTATGKPINKSINAQANRNIVDNSSKVQLQTSGGHHESHCDIPHKSQDKYIVEKVPVMNSIGGESTEGCSEHYNVRFVKQDPKKQEEKIILTDLQKAMVYGEILNKPAFKRNGKYPYRY